MGRRGYRMVPGQGLVRVDQPGYPYYDIPPFLPEVRWSQTAAGKAHLANIMREAWNLLRTGQARRMAEAMHLAWQKYGGPRPR